MPDSANPYLNFWVAAAIREALESRAIPAALLDRLRTIGTGLGHWALGHVSRHVALHYTGMASHFDVAELAYSIATVWVAETSARHADLAGRGLEVLLKEYLRDGCLPASWPVIVNKQTGFLLQVPTTEVLSTLLVTAPPNCGFDFAKLSSHLSWLRDNQEVPEGWRPENAGYWSPPTAFMAASALTFGCAVESRASDRLDLAAREELNARELTRSNVVLPAEVHDLLETHFIESRQKPSADNPPFCSMVAYGPPGTSKTTMAKYLASRLGWPLVLLNQSSFLSQGIAALDAEIEKTFRLLHRLRDVVVVFDEVEELVRSRKDEGSRESRILTTAMLPRIQDLRDRGNVIFLFLTNHLEAIDRAITRPGRFDAIKLLGPPDRKAREQLLKTLAAQHKIELKNEELSLLVAETDKLCFGELRALVMRLARGSTTERNDKTLEDLCKEFRERIEVETIMEFEQRSKTYDRIG